MATHLTTAPIGMGGLFGDEDDQQFEQQYETQEVCIGGNSFSIRQFSFHCANANQVWPGAVRLGEHLLQNREKLENKCILELGAATGALAIALISNGFRIFTCDYCDDDNVIEDNIRHNFSMNGR